MYVNTAAPKPIGMEKVMDMYKEFKAKKRPSIISPIVMDGYEREFSFREFSGYCFFETVSIVGERVVCYRRGSKLFRFHFSGECVIFTCIDSYTGESLGVTYNQFDKFCSIRTISESIDSFEEPNDFVEDFEETAGILYNSDVEFLEESPEDSEAPEAVENLEESSFNLYSPDFFDKNIPFTPKEAIQYLIAYALTIENTLTRCLVFAYDSLSFRLTFTVLPPNRLTYIDEFSYQPFLGSTYFEILDRLEKLKADMDAELLSSEGYCNDSY